MEGAIKQLNDYLHQMLECVEPLDRIRFSKLNREYTKLMNETFIEINSPLEEQYDTMRNNIAHTLTFPELKEKSIPKVIEFLCQNNT